MEAHKNANRFKGFAALYGNNRPASPPYVADMLTRYLGRRPNIVVDLGCGTGFSTLVWKDTAAHVIGVEPSGDMFAAAKEHTDPIDNIEIIQAFSDHTGLAGGIADIITCSQSFHWMEPEATLREVARLLKPGGIFAAYDCDWPPACNAQVEIAYNALIEKVKGFERVRTEYRDAFIRYPKERHLDNIRASGYFFYTRELVFANTEQADADRYYGIALSQGGLQAVLRNEPNLLEPELSDFRAAVDSCFGTQTQPVDFCYRMRLGITKFEV